MDKLEAVIELAKMSSSRHDERRKYEWQVSLAFWALIIGAIVKKSDLHLQCLSSSYGVLIGALYAFLWLRGIWVANDNDKRLSEHFRTQALNIIQNPLLPIATPPSKIKKCSFKYWFGFLGDWALLFQFIVTAVLILLFYRIT